MLLGLDIGGANIKAATSQGEAVSVPFPLWKQPELLAPALSSQVERWPECQRILVTMTGELADCFPTQQAGVTQILNAVAIAAQGRPVDVWSIDGTWLTIAAAVAQAPLVAAANWHAQAAWLAREWPTQSGCLLDVGSTTSDIIPFQQRTVAALGRNDRERLQHRELVYRGVRRTPLCALSRTVRSDRMDVPVAAEWFATTHDLFLWTGACPADEHDLQTADGRPATRAAARQRLARMLCSDGGELSDAALDEMVADWSMSLQTEIAAAVTSVTTRSPSGPGLLVVSGSGEFFARRVIDSLPELRDLPLCSLADRWSPAIATAACAYALTQLH